MKNFDIVSPVRIVFGDGTFEKLTVLLEELNAKKAFFWPRRYLKGR
jgi:hypothetical protein